MTALTWVHAVREIAERGLDIDRSATPAERAAIAADLGVISCERLQASYRLTPVGSSRYRFTCALQADFVQSCVVTLEPVPMSYRDAIDLQYWPSRDLPEPRAIVLETLADDEPEAIENGIIDVGRLLFERLVTLIDPYPRRAGAELSWSDERATGEQGSNPFAELKGLVGRSGG